MAAPGLFTVLLVVAIAVKVWERDNDFLVYVLLHSYGEIWWSKLFHDWFFELGLFRCTQGQVSYGFIQGLRLICTVRIQTWRHCSAWSSSLLRGRRTIASLSSCGNWWEICELSIAVPSRNFGEETDSRIRATQMGDIIIRAGLIMLMAMEASAVGLSFTIRIACKDWWMDLEAFFEPASLYSTFNSNNFNTWLST